MRQFPTKSPDLWLLSYVDRHLFPLSMKQRELTSQNLFDFNEFHFIYFCRVVRRSCAITQRIYSIQTEFPDNR